MPAGKTVKIGVWEDEKFIGVVIFSRGANSTLAKPYGLTRLESCELTRVALRSHEAPVTRIVSIAIKMLKKLNNGMRLIISFADPDQGHIGAIYQAGNWLYMGKTIPADEYIVNGQRMHGRSMRAKYGTHVGKSFIKKVPGSSKYRYVMPLDNEIRERIVRLSVPFPKRVKQATSGLHPESGGAAPTYALQAP